MSTELRPELTKTDVKTAASCPVTGVAAKRVRPTAAGAKGNRDWWPDQLNLAILHLHSPRSRPMDEQFGYAEARPEHRHP